MFENKVDPYDEETWEDGDLYKIYLNKLSVNESWNFRDWISNISNGVKFVLGKKGMLSLRNNAMEMTDEYRENILDRITMELERWKSFRFLFGIPAVLDIFSNIGINNIKELPPHVVILCVLWFISHFMVSRNRRVKEKVQRIFQQVASRRIIPPRPESEIIRVYSEVDPYGEEEWQNENIMYLLENEQKSYKISELININNTSDDYIIKCKDKLEKIFLGKRVIFFYHFSEENIKVDGNVDNVFVGKRPPSLQLQYPGLYVNFIVDGSYYWIHPDINIYIEKPHVRVFNDVDPYGEEKWEEND